MTQSSPSTGIAGAGRLARRARSAALPWIGLAALSALAWREGLAFAASSGGAPDVEHILFEAADNPPWLLSFVALALLVSRRRDLRAAVAGPGSPGRSALLLGPGLALVAWARLVSAPDLALLGAIAMGLGTAYALAGAPLARLAALPVLLLAFAVPVPGALVNQVVYPLQLATADYAFVVLRLLGVAATQHADVIRTGSHGFLVVEGCSGMGSMEVLALLALAWAWQTKASFARGLLLVAAAPAIAFALNGLRVVSLVLYPESDVWSVHTTQGIVAFALGALAIALLDRALPRRAPGPAVPVAAFAPASPARPRAHVFAWLGAAALASAAIPPYAPARGSGPTALLPETLAGFRAEEAPVDRLFLGSVRFERSEHRVFVADRGPAPGAAPAVAVLVGEGARSRGNSVRSPKVELLGRGFRAEERGPIAVAGPLPVERTVARSQGSRVLSYTLYLAVESAPFEALREMLALDRSPLAREGRAYAVRLATEIAPEEAEQRADRRLRAFLRLLRPHLGTLTRHGRTG